MKKTSGIKRVRKSLLLGLGKQSSFSLRATSGPQIVRLATTKVRSHEVRSLARIHTFVRSQSAPLSCLAPRNREFRARVRNCVPSVSVPRQQLLPGNSVLIPASCALLPRLSRAPEFRASRWRNFGQRKRKRDSRMLHFAGAPIAISGAALYKANRERCYGITNAMLKRKYSG